jgi:anti-sigma regulatory factor (Ser/Thr protein kinase)
MCWQVEFSLPCDGAAVASARGFSSHRLSEVLGDGLDAQDCIDDAILVTSELVSNAIQADCGHTVVRISVHRTHVRIGVEDDGHGQPQVLHPSATEDHGRGLLIVEQLSQEWGVSATPTGKQVWADLGIPWRLTAALACSESHGA